MARALIVLPDDSAQPILRAIAGASKTIRVKMFVFSDPALLDAIVAARHRGVKVRVMLNAARRSGEEDNEPTRKALGRAGVEVIKIHKLRHLKLHGKILLADGVAAIVGSINFAPGSFRSISPTKVSVPTSMTASKVAGRYSRSTSREQCPDTERMLSVLLNGRRLVRFDDLADLLQERL